MNADDKTYVEPDISVICDPSKLDDRGCNGAPDWIVEVASPGTKRIDYGIKLFKYHSAGVREYWIVNPLTKTVNVYDLEKEELSDQYIFDDDIPVCIYDGRRFLFLWFTGSGFKRKNPSRFVEYN